MTLVWGWSLDRPSIKSLSVSRAVTWSQAYIAAAPWVASSWTMALPTGCEVPVTTQTKPYSITVNFAFRCYHGETLEPNNSQACHQDGMG